MNRLFINIGVIAFLLAVSGESTRADIEAVIRQMQGSINAMTTLSDKQRQGVNQAIAEELRSLGKNLDKDKEANGPGQFKEYVSSILGRSMPLYSDAQFAPKIEWVRLGLRNYARLPAITSDDRKLEVARSKGLGKFMRAFVDASYKDTPVDVRDQLVTAGIAGTEPLSREVGSYFSPLFLYPPVSECDSKSFIKKMSSNFLMEGNETKFAPINDWLERTPDLKIQKSIIENFVETEGSHLEDAMEDTYQSLLTAL